MTLDSFLRKTAYAALFAVLLTPFIVSESLFFPFITGKNLFFRVMVEIAFAAWAVLALRDASVRPRRSPILWSMAAFTVAIGISNAFGVNPWKSFWSNFERMEGYITILHLFAYFVVATGMLRTERLWKRFMESSIWASGAVSLYALFQLFGWAVINQGGTRVDSTLGNATYLAVYALFNIFFALIVLAKDSTVWKRWTYGAIIALNLIALYNTGTRGAVLGLLAGAVVFAALVAAFDRKERRKRVVAGYALGAVAVLVVGFVAVKDASFVQQSPVLSRFASISLGDVKTQGRYYIWPMAIEGIKEKPLFGWGQENFNYVFNAKYDPRMYGHEQWFDRAHNAVLDWGIAGGLVGLAAYLSIFASAAYLLWKKAHEASFTEKALLTGLGVAYFANNMFVFDNVTSYIMFGAFLAYIQFRSTRLAKPVFDGMGEASAAAARYAGAAALVALVFCVYFFNWRAYATASSLLDALRYSSIDPVQPARALEAFEKAASYKTVGRGEVVERIVESVPRMNADENPIELRQRFFDLAAEAVERQLAATPGDARYELFAGTFYNLYGAKGPAREHLYNAYELSPTKQTILFTLGSFYLNNGQAGDAVATFKEAYELEPSNELAATYYAMSLVAMGLEAQARAFLLEATGSDDMTSDVFVQAFASAGDWKRVVSIFEARVAADPQNLTELQALAAAYLQVGDDEGAIATIRRMVQIEPAFASTGEEYIRQIRAGAI